jgi:hypothetical protein
MHHLDKYVSYLQNIGRPVAIADFDDDWSPVGPSVRAQLKDAGFAFEMYSAIQLCPPTNTSGVIGDPS